MKKLKILLGLITPTVISSCGQLTMYTGDHGSYEYKRSAPLAAPQLTTNIHHLKTSYPGFYIFADNSPGRTFWWGERVNNQFPVFVADLNGNIIDQVVISGIRRLALDRNRDRIIYEVVNNGFYELRAQTYNALGSANYEVLTSGLYPHRAIDVDPARCGKIFWVENRGIVGSNHLMQLDLKTKDVTELINTPTHGFPDRLLDIAVDPVGGHVYWTQNVSGWQNDIVGRMDYLTGTGKERWIYNQKDDYRVSYPYEIEIDFIGRRIYWADMNMNWNASARMEGANLSDRDFSPLDRYPGDKGTSGPNYHPTAIELIRLPGRFGGSVSPKEEGKISGRTKGISNPPRQYNRPRALTGFFYPDREY